MRSGPAIYLTRSIIKMTKNSTRNNSVSSGFIWFKFLKKCIPRRMAAKSFRKPLLWGLSRNMSADDAASVFQFMETCHFLWCSRKAYLIEEPLNFPLNFPYAMICILETVAFRKKRLAYWKPIGIAVSYHINRLINGICNFLWRFIDSSVALNNRSMLSVTEDVITNIFTDYTENH